MVNIELEKKTITKQISDSYIIDTANWSGDYNLIHVDEGFAQKSFFGQRIAHGLVCLGMVSNLLGNEFNGAILMSQNINYLAPIYVNDVVTATIELAEYNIERQIAILKFECKKDSGIIVASGNVKCKIP